MNLRRVILGAITILLLAAAPAAVAPAVAVGPPSAPYTAFTMTFQGWGSIDGSFSYGAGRNTLEIYQQTHHELVMRGFRIGGFHHFNLWPARGTRFVAGNTYPTQFSSTGSLPSTAVLNVLGDGQGCVAPAYTGSVSVIEAQYDDTTEALTAFAASYSVLCDGTKTVKGEIRVTSNLGYKVVESGSAFVQFGQSPVGEPGTPQQVTFEVYGTLPSTFGTATLAGEDPGAFEITTDTCSGQTVPYGESCTLLVTPRATALGGQSAMLILAEDSFPGSVRRRLTLDGYDPRDAQLSPFNLDFWYVAAYETSIPRTVTVTSSGTLPITFGQASLGGEHPTMFGITDDQCSGRTLANGQACTMTAVARPTSTNTHGAAIVLPDNSAAGSTLIGLSVNGYASDRGTFYRSSPYRILDTRYSSGLVPSGGVVHLKVAGAGAWLPIEASTAVLNVTVTGAQYGGYLSVYPTGVPRPTVSSLNFTPNWTGANSVTVQIGANGEIDFYNGGGPVHVIVDLFGYYSKGRECCTGQMGGQYHPIAEPVRLADTRTWNAGRIGAGQGIKAAASWNSTINPKVRAFAVNITATDPTGPGYLTAWHGGGSPPATSTLNFAAGATVPNFAIVPTSPCTNCGAATGWPSIGVYASNNTHIIVDVVGYYDDSTLPDGLRFEPITPTRIADSRIGQGLPSALGQGTTATIAAPASIASDTTWALATNVTAVLPTHNTFLTVWPADLPGVGQPATSNLNPVAGTTVPNAVQTMIGLGNEFHVYNNSGTCDLVVDVVGRFELYPPSPPPDWPNTSKSALSAYNARQGKGASLHTQILPTAWAVVVAESP